MSAEATTIVVTSSPVRPVESVTSSGHGRAVATTGQWTIYEVAGSELVTPLTFQPAVGASEAGGSLNDQEYLDTYSKVAPGGPGDPPTGPAAPPSR